MTYGIISDIHSDFDALKKVMLSIKSKNVDRIFCCGDIVGYGNQPQEVIELLRANQVQCVIGNHEEALFDDLAFAAMNINAQTTLSNNFNLISENNMEYLEELPSSIIDKNIRIVHGVPPDSFTDYIHYLTCGGLIDVFDSYTEQIAFCGHSHLKSIINYNGCNISYNKKISFDTAYKLCDDSRYIINVGSVSLPRGDNRDKAQFVVYDDITQTIWFYAV